MPIVSPQITPQRRSIGGGMVIGLAGHVPQVDGAFVAPGTFVIGDVHVEAGASIWFNCVVRGDVAPITIRCSL